MARLDVFVVALVSLALFNVIAAESLTSYYDGPKIYPSGEYAVVKSGENITLRCKGKEPLTWDYGRLEDYEKNIHIYVSNTSDEHYPYGTLLNIVNATVRNLGYYSCMYNRTDYHNMTKFQLEQLELERQSKRIYLFVNDSIELIKHGMDAIISSDEHKNIIIPCIPTSPDVVVTLYLAKEKVIPNQKMKILNDRKVTYNKYSGFTIPDAHVQDGNFLYNCTGTRQASDSQYFFVVVQRRSFLNIKIAILVVGYTTY